MHHVLLVDDEIYAVRGLKAGLNWDRLKVSNVYTAYNLKQAQTVFHSNPVDILVCDIEMPEGSGIELLDWVRKHYPDTIAIFMTCHADFSYAQKALQLKCFDYMLKPIDYLALENVMTRALSLLPQEKTGKEKFWMDVINQEIPSESIREEMNKRKLKLNEANYYVPILFHVKFWDPVFSRREIKLIEFALKNVFEEKAPSTMLTLSQYDFLAIVTVEKTEQITDYLRICENFIQFIHETFSIDLSAYVGEGTALKEVVSIVEDLQNKSNNHVSLARQVFSLKDLSMKNDVMPSVPWDDWKVMLNEGAKQQLLDDIQRFFINWEREDSVTVHVLRRFYENFLQMLLHVLKVKGLQSQDVFSTSILTEETDKIFKSFYYFRDWVLRVTQIAGEHIQSQSQKCSVVETVKQLIHENIGMHELSREWLANAVFLHPDYISRLFKKETGLLISEYLQQKRIENAKQLLKQTNKSVTDIALVVGYSNISYFSTSFKKLTKMGPIEFRRKHQRD